MQYQYHKAFISALLLLVLIFPSVLLFNSPQPVQAADLGIWELRDAEWIQIGNNFTAKIFQSGFSGMKVNVISGVVICDHTAGSSGESEGMAFNQKITVTLRGTYSDSSGMSGTYKFSNEGTFTSEGKQSPWSGSHSGTFNGPGGITEGQSYTISFSGGEGIIIGSGGPGAIKYLPFQLMFTVGKGVDNPDHPKFSAVTGQVEVQYPDEDTWHLAELETNLPPMTKIRTQENSVAIISFANQSTYKLGPKSEVVVMIAQKNDSRWQLIIGDLLLNATTMTESGSMSV